MLKYKRKTEFAGTMNGKWVYQFLTTTQQEAIDYLGAIEDKIEKGLLVEQNQAHWVIHEYDYLMCSKCGNSYYTGCESSAEANARLEQGAYYNYCPNCGAKMKGVEKNG